MPTPETLRRLANEADEQAASLRREADILEQQGVTLRKLADDKESSGLQHGTGERIISAMDVNASGQSSAVKRGAARATRKHPAQVKLYSRKVEGAPAGITIKDLATELDETRARVSSWFATGHANRPVPRHHAEFMRKKYGIPLSAWARIAD
jgi:hypothetical protein